MASRGWERLHLGWVRRSPWGIGGRARRLQPRLERRLCHRCERHSIAPLASTGDHVGQGECGLRPPGEHGQPHAGRHVAARRAADADGQPFGAGDADHRLRAEHVGGRDADAAAGGPLADVHLEVVVPPRLCDALLHAGRRLHLVLPDYRVHRELHQAGGAGGGADCVDRRGGRQHALPPQGPHHAVRTRLLHLHAVGRATYHPLRGAAQADRHDRRVESAPGGGIPRGRVRARGRGRRPALRRLVYHHMPGPALAGRQPPPKPGRNAHRCVPHAAPCLY
eukprot:scaffold17442_cov99-Isochrysis_galbana.AAC.2